MLFGARSEKSVNDVQASRILSDPIEEEVENHLPPRQTEIKKPRRQRHLSGKMAKISRSKDLALQLAHSQ